MNLPESFSNSSTSSRFIVSAEGLIRSSSCMTIFRAVRTRPSNSSEAEAIPDATAAASIMRTMTVRPITGLSMSILCM